MRPVQYFSRTYLNEARRMSHEEILRFLEDFRLLHEKPAASRLISMKVPEPLLSAFRFKCSERGVKYQTRIKELMTAWVLGGDHDPKE